MESVRSHHVHTELLTGWTRSSLVEERGKTERRTVRLGEARTTTDDAMTAVGLKS